ncbi:MAG: hypothetical protein ACLFUH_04445 [Bacteroidales bacterium]
MLEILKYTIPALIVFFTAFYTLRMLIKNDQKKRNYELVLKNKSLITPIRLQAYERLTLFLERISPDALVMRLNKENRTVNQLQNEMLKTIRSEFDHNLSQQIYVSPKAWLMVKHARENTVKLINTTVQEMKPGEPAIKLSRVLLQKVMEEGQSPTKYAIQYLKEEVKNFFSEQL